MKKRLISIIIICAFMLSLFPVSAFATDVGDFDLSRFTKSELDLSEYTLDDLMNMSNEEYCELVRDFERVYDPFDSYEESLSLSEASQVNVGSEEISPQWTSGKIKDGEYTEGGCHEYITAVACGVLSNDKAFFADTVVSVIAIALAISLASLLPDRDEVGILIYSGHFYNPMTKQNYASSTTNTAKTNATERYETATAYMRSGKESEAYEYLGRCLHYVQDACEPHHAANIVSYGKLSPHKQFEDYAFNNSKDYLENYTSIPATKYYVALNWDISTITHNGALVAYEMKDLVNNTSDKSEWGKCAKKGLECATECSAMVLYKFGTETGTLVYD